MIEANELDRLTRVLRADGGAAGDGLDRRRARAERRGQGAYFTPPALCDFVAGEALSARFARPVDWRADGSPRLTVLDPAAGDGRFLAAAADWLTARAVERGAPAAAARRAIERRVLLGIERDAGFAAAARRRLPGATIHRAEALLESPVSEVDVVIGNPPYLRSIRLGQTDEALRAALRGRFAATSHGEWDLYGAFLERALALVGEGGEVGLVTPSRWLTAGFAGPLRARLARARALRALVDFGAEQLFAGATTYVALVFLSRVAAPRPRIARRRAGGFAVGEIDAGGLGAAPWRLSIGGRARLLDRLARGRRTLGEVAAIVKGTGTNADRIYLGGGAVEAALTRRALRGRDVRAFATAEAASILYPYDRAGALIPPAELARRYPRAAAYLAGVRADLEAREGGRYRGEAFYVYGRPQNLGFLADPAPKIVVPDVTRGGRAALDRSAALVLDSAYALRPRGIDLGALLAVLNARVVALWLRETGVPLRGGYVRMKTAYLRGLPVPPDGAPLAAAAGLALAPDAAARREEIDDLVRQAYEVGRAAWTEAPLG